MSKLSIRGSRENSRKSRTRKETRVWLCRSPVRSLIAGLQSSPLKNLRVRPLLFFLFSFFPFHLFLFFFPLHFLLCWYFPCVSDPKKLPLKLARDFTYCLCYVVFRVAEWSDLTFRNHMPWLWRMTWSRALSPYCLLLRVGYHFNCYSCEWVLIIGGIQQSN